MKKLCSVIYLILATAMTINVHAKNTDPIAAFEELAAEIAFSDVEYIHVKMTLNKTEMLDLLNASSKCKKIQNFKVTSASKITDHINSAFKEAYSLMLEQELMDHDDGYYGRMETLEDALIQFEANESKSKLQVCIEDSVPAYSDGHRLIAVFKSGKPYFIFEIGRPD